MPFGIGSRFALPEDFALLVDRMGARLWISQRSRSATIRIRGSPEATSRALAAPAIGWSSSSHIAATAA
jgi:hypothetical protein